MFPASTAHTLGGVEMLPIEEVKEHLVKLINQVRDRHEKFTVISENRPSAVVLSYQEWGSMVETMEVLSDPDLVAELAESDDAVARGETYSEAEIRAILAERLQR